MNTWQCRWSPTLGALEDTHQNVWGTMEYAWDDQPTVFFGVYGFPDFYALWRHRRHRAILWAGTDILHFIDGYLLEKGNPIEPMSLARWINNNCESWVENQAEKAVLESYGIFSKVCPSYLGDVNLPISYEWSERPKVYLSVSGNEFNKYGWDVVEKIAHKVDVEFYLYGNTKKWISKHKNVVVRGRIPKEEMNKEISKMQCGLRPLAFDGFSEILAKSVLWGQYPISLIPYPHITKYLTNGQLISKLKQLKHKKEPNIEAAEYYRRTINKYPWNTKS